MAQIEMAASLVLFLTLLAQKTLTVITYSREELLDIRETSTYQLNQHYDQEHDFPKADPLSAPPRAFNLIPEPDTKQRCRRRGCRSDLLVRLRMCAYHPPLLSILLADVQSLVNKVDEIRTRVAFHRDIRDYNILCFKETWLAGDMLSQAVQPAGFSVHRADRNKHLSGKKKGVVYV